MCLRPLRGFLFCLGAFFRNRAVHWCWPCKGRGVMSARSFPSLSKSPTRGVVAHMLSFVSGGGSCCMQIRNCTTLSSPVVWRATHACSFHVLSASSLAPQRVLEARHECWFGLDFLPVMGGGAMAKLRVYMKCLVMHQGSRFLVHFQKLQHDAAPCKLHPSLLGMGLVRFTYSHIWKACFRGKVLKRRQQSTRNFV